jgi:hypothetical protein
MNTTNARLAATWTFMFTLVGSALLLFTGWLTDFAEWVSSDEMEFPSISPLVKAAAALFVAGVIALINYVFRWLQAKNVLPGQPPAYTPPPEG